MNSNLVHNILNSILLAIGGVTAILTYLGCEPINIILESGEMMQTLDCSNAAVSPHIMGIVAGIVGLMKLSINWIRDGGFRGLIAPQPPVQIDKED